MRAIMRNGVEVPCAKLFYTTTREYGHSWVSSLPLHALLRHCTSVTRHGDCALHLERQGLRLWHQSVRSKHIAQLTFRCTCWNWRATIHLQSKFGRVYKRLDNCLHNRVSLSNKRPFIPWFALSQWSYSWATDTAALDGLILFSLKSVYFTEFKFNYGQSRKAQPRSCESLWCQYQGLNECSPNWLAVLQHASSQCGD